MDGCANYELKEDGEYNDSPETHPTLLPVNTT
jgi:hypothetical protein